MFLMDHFQQYRAEDALLYTAKKRRRVERTEHGSVGPTGRRGIFVIPSPAYFFCKYRSASGIYGTLLLQLILLTTTAKEKTLFAGVHVYSRGIACFPEQPEQRTAFTIVQSTMLQSRDFNSRVQLALQIPYQQS